MNLNWIEIFGTLSSVVIFISLSMTSIVKLRVVNTIGCILFAIYGYYIHSYPTTILNLGIAIMNMYHLKNLYSSKESFNLISTNSKEAFFNNFLENHFDDIKKFFGDIYFDEIDKIYFLVRNEIPIGIIGWNEKENEIEIKFDYVIEKYRDLKFGKFIYDENLIFFKNLNYNKIIQVTKNSEHKSYLNSLGFIEEKENTFIKNI